MALLPPTVGERLAKCGRLVSVWGIIPGAEVELKRNGTVEQRQTITESSTTFELSTELDANDIITARQFLVTEESQDSPGVVVGDVELPPPPPSLRPSIYRCAHRIYSVGMAPGSTVRLVQSDPVEPMSNLIAEGIVNRHGWACLESVIIGSNPIFGNVITCGMDSGRSSASDVVAPPAHLPAPAIHEPLFGCQKGLDMSGLSEGTQVEILSGGGGFAYFQSCWDRVHVNLPRQLAAGEDITAVQTMRHSEIDCDVDGDVSSPPATVIPPDERIKPTIRPMLYDGDQIIRVQDQIDGGEITVLFRLTTDGEDTELGRAGASEFEEISLNESLQTGQIIRASQTLCGRTETSDPLTVQARPATIPTPSVRSPLYECGVRVVVDGVLPGVQVHVFQNGFYVGHAWANSTSVTVLIGPRLVNGSSITARQRLGGLDSGLSSPAVTVQSLPPLSAPSILPPVRLGERSIRVGGVVPGAYVQILDRGALVGTADAAEATVTVSINQPVESDSRYTATQTLCSETSASSETFPEPHDDPSAPGDYTPSSPSPIPASSLDVPGTGNSPAMTVGIGGELTFPSDPINPEAVDPSGAPYPLVIIAHGRHRASAPSYQGYRYLTNHLASHGMICVSIDLNDVNAQDGVTPETMAINTRGSVILEHVRILLDRNATSGDLLENMIDTDNIGLVGHSRGGEGVVAAQNQNMDRPVAERFSIRGVVPIAPINALNLNHRGTPLFLLYGSADNDVAGGRSSINPFFIYDHSETPKAMIFVHHARHNGFNEVWVRPEEENESILPDSLTPAQHQAIAKAYINAFFQSTLFSRSEYDIYIQGPVRPLGLHGFSIHNQYQPNDRMVVDNFGDSDSQLGLVEESPLDREQNNLNESVSYSQNSMEVWYDAEFRDVLQNPHDSRGSSLRWDGAETYTSNIDTRDVRSYNVLALRLGQQYSVDETLNPVDQPQDLLVTLETSGGSATVRAGSITDLPFPHERGGLTKAALKTVRIPLVAFQAINPSIRLDEASAVGLNFGITGQGAISIDDIEFSE